MVRPSTAPSGGGGGDGGGGRDGGGQQNVQVLLRCRPMSKEEEAAGVSQVIFTREMAREVAVVQNIAGKRMERTFTFDKVFGPANSQKHIFDSAIFPMVDEVLQGFNCTIFAYGQTGTGKTYTMGGDTSVFAKGGGGSKEELKVHAGVIPRAVKHIFECLEATGAEYSMKVSFLELYNEELTDLLGADFDERDCGLSGKKLVMMDDARRTGPGGGTVVRGLEEEIVKTSEQIFELLERGTGRRKTAATKLNKESSRSHSIFTITVHIKETTPEGEELIKVGKLNLVDLAGSENVGRSGAGAKDGRAREAGNINQSLLTLGRVITALTTNLGHIPYRDSKLTRLLRDSLGGKTKTCIIATVSPTVHCLEETLSTLDYACRAKNIKNKPEVNQKTTKTVLLKDMTVEINALRAELQSAREKHGVYLSKERFDELESMRVGASAKVTDLEERIKHAYNELETARTLFERKEAALEALEDRFKSTMAELESTKAFLDATREELEVAKEDLEIKDYVIDVQSESERQLVAKAADLRGELAHAAKDIDGLFVKMQRKGSLEIDNQREAMEFREQVRARLGKLSSAVSSFVEDTRVGHYELLKSCEEFSAVKTAAIDELETKVAAMQATVRSTTVQMGDILAKAVSGQKEAAERLVSIVVQGHDENAAHADQLAEHCTKSLGKMHAATGEQQVLNERVSKRAAQDTTRVLEGAGRALDISQEAMHQASEQGSGLANDMSGWKARGQEQIDAFARTFTESMKAGEEALMGEIGRMMSKFSAHRDAMIMEALQDVKSGVLEDGMELAERHRASMEQLVRNAGDGMQRWHTSFASACERSTSARQQEEDALHEHLAATLDGFAHVSTEVSKAVDSTKAITSRVVEAQQLEVEHLTCTFDELQTSAIEVASDSGAKMLSMAKECADAMKRGRAAIEGSMERIHAEVGESTSTAAEFARSQSSAYFNLQSDVDEFLSPSKPTGLRLRDVPTGETPTKRDIPVPSEADVLNLRCPDHEKVVEDFKIKREMQAEMAATGGADSETPERSASPAVHRLSASSTAYDKSEGSVPDEEGPAAHTPTHQIASAIPGKVLSRREPLSPRSGNVQVEEEVVRTARKKRGGLRSVHPAAPVENE